MAFEVFITHGARRDLEEIHRHIADVDGPDAADRVLNRILTVAQDLREFPERGSHPRELLALGIREFRQARFKPYRLIYRIVQKRIYIVLIADGRRDMQTILARRLISSS